MVIDETALLTESGGHAVDKSRYPVLIIPGYGSFLFQTNWIGKQIRSRGFDTVGLKLPWLGVDDMTKYADMVADRVDTIRVKHGFEKVNIFGYSLGGLIAKYYLKELEGHQHLGRAAFLAPPLAGAYLGYLGYFTPAGRQVRPGSSFLRNLEDSPACRWGSERCLSIYVRWDGVIVPSESAHLPTGYNLRLNRPISHWGVVLNKKLVHQATEFLKGNLPDGAESGREVKIKAGPVVFDMAPQATLKVRGKTWRLLLTPFRALARRSRSLFFKSD